MRPNLLSLFFFCRTSSAVRVDKILNISLINHLINMHMEILIVDFPFFIYQNKNLGKTFYYEFCFQFLF